MKKNAKGRLPSRVKVFEDLPEDLMSSSSSSADTIFNAFMDAHDNGITSRIKSSYVKSITRNTNFKSEIPVDLNDAAQYFSFSDSVNAKMSSELDAGEEEKLGEIRFIIHNLLPEFERDIMILIFDHNKIQEDIGAILGLSQEMVNYYKKRAIHRIMHLYNHRKIDINDMKSCLNRYVSKKQMEAMLLYFFKHNQRLISKELKISQSAVSARLKIGLRKLKKRAKYDKQAEKYLEVFERLMSQKSLYSSQTRIKMISEVDNYRQSNQQDSSVIDSQPAAEIEEQEPEVEEDNEKKRARKKKKRKLKKISDKPKKERKPRKLREKSKKNKKIRVKTSGFKSARTFFKKK